MPRIARTFVSTKPCKRGHYLRFTWNKSRCVECTRLDSEKYRKANRDRMNAYKRAQWAEHPEAAREYSREKQAVRRKVSAERVRETKRIWNAKFPEGNRRRAQEWMRAWRLEDRESYNAYRLPQNALRKAGKLKATPAWLTIENHEEMAGIYRRAAELSKETGIRYHVDHIVPLRGELVCGLHVPWNLRAVPAAVNLRKSSKLIEGVSA